MYPRANQFPQSISLTIKKCSAQGMVPPDGRERTVPALPVCLGNSSTAMGLWRVLIAQTENIQSLSVQPQTHAVIVQQACFRKTTEACV